MAVEPNLAKSRRSSKGSYCSAFNCFNNWSDTPEKHFFSFPKDHTRSKRWMINVGRRHDLDKTTVEYRRKNLRVCSDHFTRECFMSDEKKRLTWSAVPTLFSFKIPEVRQEMNSPQLNPPKTNPQQMKKEVNSPQMHRPQGKQKKEEPTSKSMSMPVDKLSSNMTSLPTKSQPVIEHSYCEKLNTAATTGSEDKNKDRLLDCLVSELVRLQTTNVSKMRKSMRLHSAEEIAHAARSFGMNSTLCTFFLEQLKNCKQTRKASVKIYKKHNNTNSETISWRDSLLKSMDKQRQNEALCDTVIFSSDARRISAHSCLLAAASPKLLLNLKKQKYPYMVNMADFHSSVVELVLQFIYTGMIPMESLSEHVHQLALVAKAFEITPLLNLTEQVVKEASVDGAYDSLYPVDDIIQEIGTTGFVKQSIHELTVCMDDETANTETVQNKKGSDGRRNVDSKKAVNNDVMLAVDEQATTSTAYVMLDPSLVEADTNNLYEGENATETNAVTALQFPVERARQGEEFDEGRDVVVLSTTHAASVSQDISSVSLENSADTHTDSKQTKKPLKCPHCSKRFKYMKFLTRHQHVHSGERPFVCSLCGKSFTRTHILKIHERTHSNERPFRCTVCDKAFGFARYLNVHMRTHGGPHVGEKLYLCSTCGKTFKKNDQLKVHLRRHTGERPYGCSECGKAFSQATSLAIHKRKHTGEKPYLCTVCGKQFRGSSNLIVHQRTHTGEKPYSCSICGLKVRTSLNLKRHQEAEHDGEGKKPFKCDKCDCTFSLSVQRMVHLRQHHGQVVTTAVKAEVLDSVPENTPVNVEISQIQTLWM